MRSDNPKVKSSFCYKVFGKQHKDLTKEELREFYRLQKQKSRAEHPEYRKEEADYQRKHYIENKDEMLKRSRIYHKKYRESHKEEIHKKYIEKRIANGQKTQNDGLLFKMFGVHGIQNLTTEQKRLYFKIKQNDYLKRRRNNENN